MTMSLSFMCLGFALACIVEAAERINSIKNQ